MVINEGEIDLYLNFACSCRLHDISMSNVIVFAGSRCVLQILISYYFHPFYLSIPANVLIRQICFSFSLSLSLTLSLSFSLSLSWFYFIVRSAFKSVLTSRKVIGKKIDWEWSSKRGRGRRRTRIARASNEECRPSSYAYEQLVTICFICDVILFSPNGYVVINVITTLAADSLTPFLWDSAICSASLSIKSYTWCYSYSNVRMHESWRYNSA